MINRYIEPYFADNLRAENRKLLLLLGPRQTGKTTLVRKVATQFESKTLYLTSEDPKVPAAFASAYSDYDFAGITPDNFTTFLTIPANLG